MDIKDQIISAIDKELEITGNPYLTLAQVHNLLVRESIITQKQKNDGLFKIMLQLGEIPNAIQTDSSPKQWRIYRSRQESTLFKKDQSPSINSPTQIDCPICKIEITLKDELKDISSIYCPGCKNKIDNPIYEKPPLPLNANTKVKTSLWSYYPLFLIIAAFIGLFTYNTINENVKLTRLEQKEKLKSTFIQQLESNVQIFQGLSFLNQLSSPGSNGNTPVIIFTFTTTENHQKIATTQTFKIPNSSKYSLQDPKLGYPLSLSYCFEIDENDEIKSKKLILNYSSDTIIEADFYSDILKEFINYRLAKKELDIKVQEINKEIALEGKRESARIAKEQIEAKKREVEYTKEAAKTSVKQTENRIHSYKSTYYDIEYSNGEVERIYEITYHTFDLNNNIITQLSRTNGEWVKLRLQADSYYTEGIVVTNYVFVIKNSLVKEVWINFEIPNLGYDYLDGTRIACYGITREDN